jgi:hypothetical protein
LPSSRRFAFGVALATACVNGALPVPPAFVAVTVNANAPETSGVPAIAPVFAFSVIPEGKLPALIENVIGAVPVAMIVAPVAAVPAVAAGNAVAGPVIAGGVGGGGGGGPPLELLPEPPPPPPQATNVSAAAAMTPQPRNLPIRFVTWPPA